MYLSFSEQTFDPTTFCRCYCSVAPSHASAVHQAIHGLTLQDSSGRPSGRSSVHHSAGAALLRPLLRTSQGGVNQLRLRPLFRHHCALSTALCRCLCCTACHDRIDEVPQELLMPKLLTNPLQWHTVADRCLHHLLCHCSLPSSIPESLCGRRRGGGGGGEGEEGHRNVCWTRPCLLQRSTPPQCIQQATSQMRKHTITLPGSLESILERSDPTWSIARPLAESVWARPAEATGQLCRSNLHCRGITRVRCSVCCQQMTSRLAMSATKHDAATEVAAASLYKAEVHVSLSWLGYATV